MKKALLLSPFDKIISGTDSYNTLVTCQTQTTLSGSKIHMT